MKTKLPTVLLLILLGATLLPAQTNIRSEVLGDKVERYYRPKAASQKPWFFQQVENLFNVVLPPKDQLPFGVSVAFLVGVSQYDYLSPQLPFVKNDLEDMRQFLLNTGGFDTVYVAREKIVNRDLIEDYMRNKFARGLSKRDRLLFYYAGHGADYGGKTGYMQFSGARSERFVSTQLLAINEASNWCSEFSIGHLLFVFDCCASGLAFAPRGEADQINALLATLSRNGSRAVMTAGTAGEKTYEVERRDGKGNGVFTRAFLNAAATGLADKGDGFMTIDEIYARLKDELARFSVQYRQNLTPKLWALDEAQYRGTFVLVNPEASARRIALAEAYSQSLNARPRSNDLVPRTIVNNQPPYTLRSEALDNLSTEVVKSMLVEKRFYDAIYNPTAKSIENQYEQLVINNAKVVVDYATGLIWQQNGSANSMTFGQTPDYIKHLNAVRYAGYSDWRLPTLEEAMSLLESTRRNGSLYIDTVFDTTQQWIWTSDKDNAVRVWYVFFSNGSCYRHEVFNIPYFVRAVRSGWQSKEQMVEKTEPGDLDSLPPFPLRRERRDNLSEADVKAMLRQNNFYCGEYEWSNAYSNLQGKGLPNEFELQQGGKVVFDRATGLMWQQAGSGKEMDYKNAQAYVIKLNKDRLVGYSDWRLPTLEEAMSLMESKQLNGDLYINSMFDQKQRWIWTGG